MDLLHWALLAGGLVALTLGGELLVRGASRLAAKLGISPLVIGLTIVAYGTSAPELAVSITAALAGNADLAVANVVGSNSFNVLFILGLCALIAPLAVQRQLIRLDVPVMSAASVLMMVFAWNGLIDTLEGVVFLLLGMTYTWWLIRLSRSEPDQGEAEPEEGGFWLEHRLWGQMVLIGAGIGTLTLGSGWLVEGATTLARSLGVSDALIGLTIVAAGTSLPELMTSLVATYKGQRDIAVGNVVGSNIFNILLILGVSSILTPGGLNVGEQMLTFDMPVALVAALACLPIFITGARIARGEGALFLGGYLAYLGYLTYPYL